MHGSMPSYEMNIVPSDYSDGTPYSAYRKIGSSHLLTTEVLSKYLGSSYVRDCCEMYSRIDCINSHSLATDFGNLYSAKGQTTGDWPNNAMQNAIDMAHTSQLQNRKVPIYSTDDVWRPHPDGISRARGAGYYPKVASKHSEKKHEKSHKQLYRQDKPVHTLVSAMCKMVYTTWFWNF